MTNPDLSQSSRSRPTSDLYASYVSAYKAFTDPGFGEAPPTSFLRWCRARYLPLLRGVARDEPILDLGCGDGRVMTFLAAAGFTNVVGIDLSDEQVSRARARGLDARTEDAFQHLPGHPGTYGAILAVDLLEHLSKQEILDLLDLAHEALRPDGVLLVQSVNGAGLLPGPIQYGDFTHATTLSPTAVEHVLRRAGFRDIVVTEAAPVASGPGSALRVALWQVVRATATLVKLIETGRVRRVWTENLLASARASATVATPGATAPR